LKAFWRRLFGHKTKVLEKRQLHLVIDGKVILKKYVKETGPENAFICFGRKLF
jgi:hypothetical protein